MEQGNSRLVRMAIGRQSLLEAANDRAADTDYVGVVDLDDAVLEPPTPEAVIKGIERLQVDRSLFAIGATSRPVYYDFALPED